MRPASVRLASRLRPASWRPKAVISDSPGRWSMGRSEKIAVIGPHPWSADQSGRWSMWCCSTSTSSAVSARVFQSTWPESVVAPHLDRAAMTWLTQCWSLAGPRCRRLMAGAVAIILNRISCALALRYSSGCGSCHCCGSVVALVCSACYVGGGRPGRCPTSLHCRFCCSLGIGRAFVVSLGDSPRSIRRRQKRGLRECCGRDLGRRRRSCNEGMFK